jgi:hypothetical protein
LLSLMPSYLSLLFAALYILRLHDVNYLYAIRTVDYSPSNER